MWSRTLLNPAVALLVLAAAGGVWAQEGDAQRITVPLSDPNRPYTLKATLLNGSMTVRGYDGKQVLVDVRSERDAERRARRDARRADGLRRIDLGPPGLTVEEGNGVVSIRSGGESGETDLTVQVPVATSLTLRVTNGGDITVERVSGDLDVQNLNGKVRLVNVSGSVVAHSLNDDVVVTMDRVAGDKPMSFTSLNGNIDVTLPPDIRSQLRMKTDNGEVYSDFDLTLQPNGRVVEETRGGRYRARIDRAIVANVNGGGPELRFTTLNGKIYVRKRK